MLGTLIFSRMILTLELMHTILCYFVFVLFISNISKKPAFYDLWGKLKDTGILQGRLINHVWSRFNSGERRRLLEIMEQFDLICPAPNESTSPQKKTWQHPGSNETHADASDPLFRRSYYVPSLFNPVNVKEKPDIAISSSLTFFVDFHGLFTSKATMII